MSEGARILLVEDDPNEVAVVLRALERAGCDFPVETARDGEEAIRALGIDDGPRNPPPRVVFLDLKMPRMDGWEVLRRIREHRRTAEVPVVVVSSSDRREDIQRSYALGANSFLVKRHDPRGPGRYFAEAARYWIELNHAPAGG